MNEPQTFYDFYDYEIKSTSKKKLEEEIKGYPGLVLYPMVTQDFVGIEVEIEDTPYSLSASYLWGSHEDGSLRNNGNEYISSPIYGKYIGYALQILKHKLEKRNNYSFSERTSVHIHLNIRDMSVDSFCNFMLIYFLLETLLFHYVDSKGTSRVNNVFCHSLKDSKGFSCFELLKSFFTKEMKQEEIARFLYSLINHWPKYTALNLACIRNLGTVEFRHMGGNLDIPYLIDWINIILRIKQSALNLKYEELIKTIYEVNTTSYYEATLIDILGPQMPLLYPYVNHAEMEETITKIKELIGAVKNERISKVLKEFVSGKSKLAKYYTPNLLKPPKKGIPDIDMQFMEMENQQAQPLAEEYSWNPPIIADENI